MNTSIRTGAVGVTGIILTTITILLVAGIVILIIKPRPAEILPPSVVKIASVGVTPVIRKDINETIIYSGTIQAQTFAVLAAEIGGQITSINAAKGDSVAAGQPLVAIDRRAVQINLDRATINLKQAEADLARWLELKQTGSVAVSDFENMQTRRNLAAVAVDDARLALEKCVLTAPFAGIIADKSVETGEMAAPVMPMMHLINIDQVKASLDVAERDVTVILCGQTAAVTMDALPGQIFTGKVVFVAASAAPRSNTFRTELAVANPSHQLRPGMICRVTLDRRTIAGALIAPLAALIPSKGQYISFVAIDGHAVRRVVKLEAIIANQAVISEGLTAGEQVIIEGSRTMADGQSITITPSLSD